MSPFILLKMPICLPLNIGLLHGSVQIPGLVDEDEVIITPSQIAGCGMDYLALGHWHSFGDYSQQDVVALYPGSPEIVGLDQAEQGQVLVVDLDNEGHCAWEQVVTGTLQYHQQDLDLADFANLEELIQAILVLADGEAMPTGMRPARSLPACWRGAFGS